MKTSTRDSLNMPLYGFFDYQKEKMSQKDILNLLLLEKKDKIKEE